MHHPAHYSCLHCIYCVNSLLGFWYKPLSGDQIEQSARPADCVVWTPHRTQDSGHRVVWGEHHSKPNNSKCCVGIMCEIKWGIFLCFVFLFSTSTEPPSTVSSHLLFLTRGRASPYLISQISYVFFSTQIPIYKNNTKLLAISSDNDYSTFKPLFSGQRNLKVKNV